MLKFRLEPRPYKEYCSLVSADRCFSFYLFCLVVHAASTRIPCNQLSLKGFFPKMSDTLPSPHTVLFWFKDIFGSPPFSSWLRVTGPGSAYPSSHILLRMRLRSAIS